MERRAILKLVSLWGFGTGSVSKKLNVDQTEFFRQGKLREITESQVGSFYRMRMTDTSVQYANFTDGGPACLRETNLAGTHCIEVWISGTTLYTSSWEQAAEIFEKIAQSDRGDWRSNELYMEMESVREYYAEVLSRIYPESEVSTLVTSRDTVEFSVDLASCTLVFWEPDPKGAKVRKGILEPSEYESKAAAISSTVQTE